MHGAARGDGGVIFTSCHSGARASANPESRTGGAIETLDSGFRLRRPRNDEFC